jgi:CheY-like chemotaxis protein
MKPVMDKSDINPTLPSRPHQAGDAVDLEHWRGIVAELGAEIAGPLTSALERIIALSSSGRIDRQGLRGLREEVEKARQVGIESQQLARLASGRVRQTHERVQLSAMLGGVLSHRARETQARGIDITLLAATSVEVFVDAPLLFSLINTLLDWALDSARSTIELRVEIKTWPAHGRITCHFERRPVARLDDGATTPTEASRLDSMHWRLLQQTARAMGLPLERAIEASSSTLTLEFPRTVNESMQGASAVEIDEGFATSINTKPLAGSHVLVVARRRDVRVQVREALRDMGLIVDFVSSVEEAVDFCRDGLPHAIVVESVLCGDRFGELRQDIAAEVPEFVFIEIIEDSRAFEMSGFTPAGMARVGRDVMAQSLPSALLFELARGS